MKIYFITRTYVIDSNVTDCGNIRNRCVELMRKKYDVVVVTPNYTDSTVISEDGFIKLPYHYKSIDRYAERIGIYEDYLDSWTRQCINYLKDIVTKEDIIFATSGGELAGIKIADLLKRQTGCKTILNFHDPVNYTTVNGKRTGGKYRNLHVRRDRITEKYVQTADYIITSSDSYRKILESIYPEKKEIISNVYFGYINQANVRVNGENPHKPIKMIYAGSMGIAQRAEVFMKVWGRCENIKIEYIGTVSSQIKRMAEEYSNVILRPPMKHEEFLQYMEKEADIGLVSLIGDEWGACVPSKIFDLINLEIPILAILPDGDAKNLINSGYGFAAGLDEVKKNQENLVKLQDLKIYMDIVENMRSQKPKWYMNSLFEKVYEIIDRVIASGMLQ